MRILVVDDVAPQRRMMERVLVREGLGVVLAACAEEALERLESEPLDLVITDVRMPGMDGVELCEELRRRAPDLPVVLISAFEDVSAAVRAMKLGARDVLTKPCEPDHLLHVIRRALADRERDSENRRLREDLERREGIGRLLGSSPRMDELRSLVRRAAASGAPVLIQGESGTGKDLVARAIHVSSARVSRPFKAVNVAALPAGIFERELFGHVRGAFTGADADRPGLFVAADRGTLLLDEIGELSPELQPKLLGVLENGLVTPVGGTEPRRVDVRVLAATNRPLADDIRGGRFREDLFFRLNVIDIRVPSLGERAEDVPLLARHFLAEAAAHNDRHLDDLDDDAIAYLRERSWPGNIRELANLVERAVLLTRGPAIGRADLEAVDPQGAILREDLPYPFPMCSLEHVGRVHIRKVLEQCGGNRKEAARVLGISRSTLWQKLKDDGAAPGDD